MIDEIKRLAGIKESKYAFEVHSYPMGGSRPHIADAQDVEQALEHARQDLESGRVSQVVIKPA